MQDRKFLDEIDYRFLPSDYVFTPEFTNDLLVVEFDDGIIWHIEILNADLCKSLVASSEEQHGFVQELRTRYHTNPGNYKIHYHKKINNDIFTRRSFFKKITSITLPILGILGTSFLRPLEGFAATSCMHRCEMSCSGTCQYTCQGKCYWNCQGSCSGSCSTSCGSTCSGQCVSCTGTCNSTCTGQCASTCDGSCSGWCTGSCSGSCSRACSGVCGGGCSHNCSAHCGGCRGRCTNSN